MHAFAPRIALPSGPASMTSPNSVLLRIIMATRSWAIGRSQNATASTDQMAPFSHRISPRPTRFMCTTKICAVCCRCPSKRKSARTTMCSAIALLQTRLCSHLSKRTRTTCASAQLAHHALPTECSMCHCANLVRPIFALITANDSFELL